MKNELIIFILLIINFFITLLLCVWPRLMNRDYGIDEWRYLLVAGHIKKNKTIHINMNHKYLIEGPSDYPPLLMILLSLFPKSFIDRFKIYIMPFINAVIGFIIFIFTFLIFNNIYVALLAQFIYAFSPQNSIESGHLTPRILGLLGYTLAIIPLFFLIINPSKISFLFYIVTMQIVFFSHKFATQFLFLLSLVLSIIFHTFLPFSAFIFSAIVAIIISRGFYLIILHGHIAMFKYWFANRKYVLTHQIREITFKNSKDFISLIKLGITRFPLAGLIMANPLILISVPILIYSRPLQAKLSTINYLNIIILVCFFTGVATSAINYLKPFGEGIKYILYASPPAAILSSFFIVKPDAIVCPKIWHSFLYLLISFNLCMTIFIQYRTIAKDKTRSKDELLDEVIKNIQTIEKNFEVRLMTMPLYLADSVMAFIKGKVFSTDSAIKHPEYTGYYPRLTKPLNQWFDKYNVTHFLLKKSYATVNECKVKGLAKIIFENQDYILIKVK